MAAVLQQSIAYLSMGKQVEKLNAEIGLTRQKIVTEIAQTENTIPIGIGFNNSTVVEGLVAKQLLTADKQMDKITADISNETAKITADISNETAKTNADISNETAKTNADISNSTATSNANVSKAAAEITLLSKKSNTEDAQIDVIDKQKDLYTAQTNGFARDAEQKLAKIMADSWAVRRTTDDATTVDGTGLTDGDIGDVIEKAKAGIGA